MHAQLESISQCIVSVDLSAADLSEFGSNHSDGQYYVRCVSLTCCLYDAIPISPVVVPLACWLPPYALEECASALCFPHHQLLATVGCR